MKTTTDSMKTTSNRSISVTCTCELNLKSRTCIKCIEFCYKMASGALFRLLHLRTKTHVPAGGTISGARVMNCNIPRFQTYGFEPQTIKVAIRMPRALTIKDRDDGRVKDGSWSPPTSIPWGEYLAF